MRHFCRILIPTALLSLTLGDGLVNEARPQNADDQAAQTANVDELLRRLDEIDQETQAVSGRSSGARTDQFAVLLEQSDLGTYQTGREQVRYLITRLILINLGDAPARLRTDDLVLVADGDEFRLSTLHEQLRASTVYTGRDSVRFDSVAPPEELSIAAGGTAAVWLMYSGLPPAPRVPQMTLRIPQDDQVQEIDVNHYQRGVLGYRDERIGPADCLALVSVTGELNTVNAADFANELDRLGSQGVARVVVSWNESSSPLSHQIRDWLFSARANSRTVRNEQMPVLPASLGELHFAGLPETGNGTRHLSVNGVMIHADEAAAVLAALRTAFEAVPRDELRRQIVNGPDLTRAAALTHGGSRLSGEDLPLVLRSLDDPDEQVRRGAIAALSHFAEPEALSALMATVHSGSAELSLAALEALASSRYPAAHSRLMEYLEKAPPDSRIEIVGVLSRHPRPEWSGMLFEFTSADDDQLRLAALQAIVSVGHARLVSILTNALTDEEAGIRQFAFAGLAARTDAESEQAALDFALTLLETEPPNETMTVLLTRTRDQRAIPLLMKHLDEPGEYRSEVIHLMARVAGQAAADMLVKRYDGFSLDERVHALRVLHELQAPQARDLALSALEDGQQQLLPQATRILATEADAEAVEALADEFRSDKQQSWSWVCNALRMIGTPAARQVLLEARASDNDVRRSLAADALQRLDRESPAFHVTEQGLVRVSEQKLEEAEALFTLAIQFDDQYASAYSHRGFVRLRRERVDEARGDFEQALALNPYEGLAVAGMAITRTLQGDYRDGVRIIEENAARFPDDPIYAYNSACVYGVALHVLDETEPSGERTARIEDYRVRALLLLKRAVDLGFNDWETLQSDPDLDPLRELDEFQVLLREWTQNPEDAEPSIRQEDRK